MGDGVYKIPEEKRLGLLLTEATCGEAAAPSWSSPVVTPASSRQPTPQDCWCTSP